MENSEKNELEVLVATTSPQDLTVDDLKNYMRIDFEDAENDRFIGTILTAAKSFVQTYLGWKFNEWVDGDIPSEITIATLAISEHWYKNRGVLTEDISKQELPYVFEGILDMHRNWQVSLADSGFNNQGCGGYYL